MIWKKSKRCKNNCLQLIRSEDPETKNKGLSILNRCFRSEATFKGIYNKKDRDIIFNDFLFRVNRYPPKGTCHESKALFHTSLKNARIDFLRKEKTATKNLDYIDFHGDSRQDKTSSELNAERKITKNLKPDSEILEGRDCMLKVFEYLKQHYPKDVLFLEAYANREGNLKDLAEHLFMSYGAIKTKKYSVFQRLYEVKRRLC